MRRIEILFGRQLAEVDAPTLHSLVTGAVREDTDLDYKERLYGQADADKRDLAGDVAAMANTIGGVIVLGVAEVDGSPTRLTPIALSEGEELRMRQTVTSLVAPAPQVSIHRVPETTGSATGFYLISIPRSPDAPHAVRVNDALKYARRDGARTRWLSESEVADAYRSRFQQATAQIETLDQIFTEGKAALDVDETAWLSTAISPLSSGRMEIRQRTIAEARTNWIAGWASPGQFGSGVFHSGGFDVSAGVGRVVIAAGRERGSKSRWGHAELYQDGAGFVAIPLWKVGPPDDAKRDMVQIDDEHLINAGVSGLSFLIEHASRHCGAVGDAIAQAQIVVSGTRPCSLVYSRQGFRAALEGSRQVHGFPISRRQVNLEECQRGTGLLIAARMLLTEPLQYVAIAEVLQISTAGELRRRYFNHGYSQLVEAWAKLNGVAMIDTLPAEER
jgi:hypothetical protein